MGEAKLKSGSVNSAMTRALGELLNLARAGRLRGFAYASIIEDNEGDIAGGCSAIHDGNKAIDEALRMCVDDLVNRMKPGKKSVLIDMSGNALESTVLN
jgi:hypothetical protein